MVYGEKSWAMHHNTRSWNSISLKLSIPGPWKQINNISGDLACKGVDVSKIIKGLVGFDKSIFFWIDIWNGAKTLAEKYSLFGLESNKWATVADRIGSTGQGRIGFGLGEGN
ncbi:hypothetical protein HanPI659440_Chr03g0118681 [Helianthus annuus]|nr:hypothetical protein HanPI659440_Chr03g0118681 [Helianthus annuus]